jgi:protein-S-isoprenylcysteine O-methyltransferase Ste14
MMKTQAQLLVGLQMILLLMLAGALFILPAEQVGWLRILGFILALAGMAVLALAILTHFWVNKVMVSISPQPNAQAKLVQTGIYAHIRHPIYSGVMLSALGVALAHGHFFTVLVALILVAFFTYKSTFEENWLMQVYPEYAAYRQRAGRFWPRFAGRSNS